VDGRQNFEGLAARPIQVLEIAGRFGKREFEVPRRGPAIPAGSRDNFFHHPQDARPPCGRIVTARRRHVATSFLKTGGGRRLPLRRLVAASGLESQANRDPRRIGASTENGQVAPAASFT